MGGALGCWGRMGRTAGKTESIKEETALASWRTTASLLYPLLNSRRLMQLDGEKEVQGFFELPALGWILHRWFFILSS